jgi:vacuolar-type H+-ATPase subunit I/STV1
LRYFGSKTYRALVPFFVGLILGDFAHGGLWTLVGCLVPNFRVYPMNW